MKHFAGCLLIILMLGIVSCDKDPEITATEAPGVEFPAGENPFQNDSIIHAAVGKKFTINATLSDAVGLTSFNLYYPDWYLNNTIDLTHFYPDETLLEYKMSFHFEVPDDVDQDEEYHIRLTVTNLGNLFTERELVVRMDGDYSSPTISEVWPVNNSTVPSAGMQISFRVQDDRELKYVVFDFPGGMVYDSITSFRGGKAYSYDEAFEDLAAGNYSFSIKAVDSFENFREKNVDFTISE